MTNRLPAKRKITDQEQGEAALKRMQEGIQILKPLWEHDAKQSRMRLEAFMNEGFSRAEAFNLLLQAKSK